MIGAESHVKTFSKLIAIGLIAGTVLAESLRLIYTLTKINAYNLLFNFDYIPVIGVYSNTNSWTGMTFHYFTCVGSVVVSYYFLKNLNLKRKHFLMLVYFL